MEINKREFVFDYIRVIACIGIIGIHVSNLTLPATGEGIYVVDVLQTLFRVGLPLFFIISGSLLLGKKYDSLKDFYLKRFVSVIIPFWIYSLFYAVIVNPVEEIEFTFNAAWTVIKRIPRGFLSLLYGEQYYHLWFVYTIIGIYLVLPFIKVLVDNLSVRMKINLILLIVVFTFVNTTLKSLGFYITINDFIFFSWIKYVIIGYFVTENWFKKYLTPTIIIGAVAFILQVLEWSLLNSIQEIHFYDLGTLELLFSMGLFAAFIKFKHIFKDNRLSKTVSFFSKYTFSIYMIHAFVLKHIQRLYNYNLYFEGTTKQLGTLLLIMAEVFIISFIISFVVDNTVIKLIKKLIRV